LIKLTKVSCNKHMSLTSFWHLQMKNLSSSFSSSRHLSSWPPLILSSKKCFEGDLKWLQTVITTSHLSHSNFLIFLVRWPITEILSSVQDNLVVRAGAIWQLAKTALKHWGSENFLHFRGFMIVSKESLGR
jgi:hypothetical protein